MDQEAFTIEIDSEYERFIQTCVRANSLNPFSAEERQNLESKYRQYFPYEQWSSFEIWWNCPFDTTGRRDILRDSLKHYYRDNHVEVSEVFPLFMRLFTNSCTPHLVKDAVSRIIMYDKELVSLWETTDLTTTCVGENDTRVVNPVDDTSDGDVPDVFDPPGCYSGEPDRDANTPGESDRVVNAPGELPVPCIGDRESSTLLNSLDQPGNDDDDYPMHYGLDDKRAVLNIYENVKRRIPDAVAPDLSFCKKYSPSSLRDDTLLNCAAIVYESYNCGSEEPIKKITAKYAEMADIPWFQIDQMKKLVFRKSGIYNNIKKIIRCRNCNQWSLTNHVFCPKCCRNPSSVTNWELCRLYVCGSKNC
ncbi:hypothetical protein WA588_004188, partial [Blastocystis sp. NMH]